MMLTFHLKMILTFISGVQRGVLQLLQRDVGGAPPLHPRHLSQLPQHHRHPRHVPRQPGACQPPLATQRLHLQPENI